MTDFEKDLTELEEMDTVESPACIIGTYFFVSD